MTAGDDFRGVWPYLVSPIDGQGRVKDDVLAALIDRLITAGVHGLAPLGSTGEFAYLSREQKRRVVEVTVAAARGRVPVAAGVAATTIADGCRQAREMVELGVDGIIAVLEAYFPLPEEGIVGYFTAVAEAAARPVVVYTNPNFQRADLSIAALARLAAVPNIRYLKDASTNTGRLLSLINRAGDDLRVFAASSHIAAAVMLIGGVGWMAGPACLVPEASVRLYDLCRAERWADAMTLQRQLWPLNEAFAKYHLAACIKGGLQLQGLVVGDPLPPQAPLDAAARRELAGILDAIAAVPA